MKRRITPPELAARWGITPEKVIGWIRRGELRAINAATSLDAQRPRYLIDEADIELFDRRREVVTRPPLQPKERRREPQVTEYF